MDGYLHWDNLSLFLRGAQIYIGLYFRMLVQYSAIEWYVITAHYMGTAQMYIALHVEIYLKIFWQLKISVYWIVTKIGTWDQLLW